MDNLIETIPGLGWSQIDKRAFEHDITSLISQDA
jgi:hypothetical protein